MAPNLVENGPAQIAVPGGDVFDRLMACNMDPGALRPYRRRKDGRTVVSLLSNKWDKAGKRLRKEVVLANANTTMTKDSWLLFDQTVIDIARTRLSVWNDLRSSAQLVLADGLGTIMLQQQRRGDITPATQSMDGMRMAPGDQAEYDSINLPLPITHKDFHFSSRDIAASARGGHPLDTVNVEMAGYHVADLIEDTVIGSVTPFSYGGASVYGYLTFPSAITGTTLTNPTTGTFDPNVLRNEILANVKLLLDNKKRGPFDIMYGPAWLPYLGQRYSTYEGRSGLQVIQTDVPTIRSMTLHEKIAGFKMIIRERNSMTARAVIGMDIQTVQWDSHGGFQKNFKVLCIMVPQLRADIDGNCGILIADVA